MTQRPRSHVLEDQSLDQLTAIFHREHWTVERIKSDYGEDLLVRIFIEGRVTPWIFFVQVKAVTSIKRFLISRGRYLSVPVSAAHLQSWRGFREPVLLAVWDSKTNLVYWQTVHAALAAEDRRAEWRGRPPITTRLKVPTSNQLDAPGLQRVASRARAAWERLTREKDGAKVLIDALREQLGLTISYDPQYGTLTIPEGRFVPNPKGGEQAYYFGRAARDMDRIAAMLGVSRQEAFERTMQLMIPALRLLAEGKPAIIFGPNGEVVDIWENAERISEDFFRMFEESDED